MKAMVHRLMIVTLLAPMGLAPIGCGKTHDTPTEPPKKQETLTGPSKKQVPIDTALPDFSALKEGMSLDEARTLLGSQGCPRANPSPEEAIHDFDFDGVSVQLIVQPIGNPIVVKKVVVHRHGMTAAEVRAERGKKWAEWVKAHPVGKSTDKNSEPKDSLDTE
ncbi:MAG: hypothetical protein JW818_13675 [Pirellulales bacterium]|nr:hypothetical protein [Pirellulales bacterium]